MTTFDIVVCSILGLSLLSSLSKGFVKEVFSLLSYLGGFLLAIKYQGNFAQVLMENISSKPIAKVIAFVIIYVLAYTIISLMGKVIKGMLVSGTKLSMFDRLMGAIVGFGRGMVIVIALTFPLQFFPEIMRTVTKGSETIPYLVKALTFVNQNIGNFKFQNPLKDFNIDEAKEKLKELKAVNNMVDQLEEFKDKLPNISEKFVSDDKEMEEYSKDDLQKLNDILKSVEKK
ncbi:MAG: CvpA family protein [Nitrospinota bacterium]|nr:CvpA family protein [Nitrospinota bacterium]